MLPLKKLTSVPPNSHFLIPGFFNTPYCDDEEVTFQISIDTTALLWVTQNGFDKPNTASPKYCQYVGLKSWYVAVCFSFSCVLCKSHQFQRGRKALLNVLLLSQTHKAQTIKVWNKIYAFFWNKSCFLVVLLPSAECAVALRLWKFYHPSWFVKISIKSQPWISSNQFHKN